MQDNFIHGILFVSSFCVKNTNKLIKHYISGAGLVLILEVEALNARQWTNSIKKMTLQVTYHH